MSLASVWASAMAGEAVRTADVVAAKPASLLVSNLVAEVTQQGGLSLSNGIVLTAAEALQLGQWITETFS